MESLEPRRLLSAVEPTSMLSESGLFAANCGQWDADVDHVYQSGGVTAVFTDSGLTYGCVRTTGSLADGDLAFDPARVSMRFDGAAAVSPVGAGRTPTTFNYHLGDDPSRWARRVPTYESVLYEDLYPGIDGAFLDHHGQLKVIFTVAPGADAGRIAMTYDGAEELYLDDAGNLHIVTAVGELIDTAPVITQQIGQTPVTVDGAFDLVDADTVAYTITGAVDSNYELVIDPQLAWSTYLGGTQADSAQAVATDSTRGVYVAGWTLSASWVAGGYDTTHNGFADAFLARIAPAAGVHRWTTYVGGPQNDYGYGVAVTSADHAVIVGQTLSSAWADATFQNTYQGNGDGFICYITRLGNYAWGRYIGGTAEDSALDVAVDGNNRPVITGMTESPGWTAGGYDTTLHGTSDAFVLKLAPWGTPRWSTYVGGSGNETGHGVDVGGPGEIYIVGETTSASWATGGYDTTYGNFIDGFIARVQPRGSFRWSTYVGGSQKDIAYDVEVDAFGTIVVAGQTFSSGWTAGGDDLTYAGQGDAFAVKVSKTGAHRWSTYMGGTGTEDGRGITTNATGSVYVCGSTYSPGWVTGGWDTVFGGVTDGFLVRFLRSGQDVQYSTFIGGANADTAYDVDAASDNFVFVAGETASPLWVAGGPDTTYNFGNDGFLLRGK